MNQPRTFALATIAAKVAEGFPNFKPEKTFEDVAKKSMSITNHILSYKVDRKECNVQILLKKERPLGATMTASAVASKSVYSLIRFFPLGDKWEVSFDIVDGEVEAIFDKLLDAEYDEEE